MPALLTRLLLGFFTAQTAQAVYSPAQSFYRSPASPFVSGQTSLELLERGKKSELTMSFYQVRKDHGEFSLGSALILRDLDLSRKALATKTSEIGNITRSEPPWYEFESEKGQKSWKTADELVPLPDDLGLAYLFANDNLRAQPDWKSQAVTELKRGQRLLVQSIQNDFAEVTTLDPQAKTGFVELSRVILKIDFASHILTEKGSWRPFSHREGTAAVLSKKTKIPLEKIKGIITQAERGVVTDWVNEQKLAPRSVVEIRRGEWVRWAESDLKGHGRVFWKLRSEISNTKPKNTVLSTDEILGLELFSSSVNPKNPNQALASAKGVFLTEDGKQWKKLDQFSNDSPVAISGKGELFVGGFRSVDQGKNFLPYLRWEDLTQLLESRHKRTPGLLKLTSVKPLAGDQIEIQVDTGVWKAWMVGSTRFGLVTNWKISKEN